MGATSGVVIESTEIVTESRIVVFGKPGEILGPNTPYEKQRVALLNKHAKVLGAAKLIESIETPEQLEVAVEIGRTLQSCIRDSEAFFKPVKEQIDALKKPVLEAEKKDIDVMKSAKSHLGVLVTDYERREERKREAAEREARAAAEREAQENQLDRAIELEASGDLGQAEAALEDVPIPIAVVTPRTAPPVAGTIGRKRYTAEVVNLQQLVQAVAAGKVPIGVLQVNQSFLNTQANAYRESFAYPGCRLTVDSKTHFRS